MNILIVAGGSSSERKISLTSAKAVRAALESRGHVVAIFDFKKGIPALKKAILKCDVVFPVMHGKEGEDGSLYKFLRSQKKPFVGSDLKGAQVAFDKILFKKYCDVQGIRTPRWKVIKNTKHIRAFGFPCVLKAASGGSSLEVALLHSEADLASSKLKKILRLQDALFVEEMIDGIEITVGVLGSDALPVIEIAPPEGKWFDFENKYSGETREIPFAPSVKKDIQKKAQTIAMRVHRDLKLGNYSRTDFIVKNSIPYVLEVNTPGGVGMTPESLFPKAGKAAGLEFPELLEKILKLSFKTERRN